MNAGQIFAIFTCAVIVMFTAFLIWWIFETRAAIRDRAAGRHARVPFADPDAAADRHGDVTQAWLRSLHEPELPVAGRLAIEPVPPEPATRPQEAIKDVVMCEFGPGGTQGYVDGLFADADLDAMAEKYAEVTS